jgi:hypothetical protein
LSEEKRGEEKIFGEKAKARGAHLEKRVYKLGRGAFMEIVNVLHAIIIVLCISIDKSNIRTRSLRNTHSQETQHLSWETL